MRNSSTARNNFQLSLQIAQDVLDQTEMIYQDFGKNTTQAYIKHKAHHHQKANASKLN